MKKGRRSHLIDTDLIEAEVSNNSFFYASTTTPVKNKGKRANLSTMNNNESSDMYHLSNLNNKKHGHPIP